jgi:hypothetical protein
MGDFVPARILIDPVSNAHIGMYVTDRELSRIES